MFLVMTNLLTHMFGYGICLPDLVLKKNQVLSNWGIKYSVMKIAADT